MQTFRALRVIEQSPGFFDLRILKQSLDDLPDHEVLVRVLYSSLNYKDALSARGHRGVTRNFPHTPGIDAFGVVVESRNDAIKPGQKVIVVGYDLGMNTPGGFGEYIRVPAAWCVPAPAGPADSYWMALGTAGLTAALCVDKLQRFVQPAEEEILVTGASGGVGIISVALLAKLGYRVVACTAKVDHADMLGRLGARRIVDRAALIETSTRHLLKPVWAGAIDTVGGETLNQVIKSLRYGGAVTACGMVGGETFHASVFPFILRGVNLLGVDSVELPLEQKAEMWRRLANEWAVPEIMDFCEEISLEELPAAIERIHRGKMVGRAIVRHRHEPAAENQSLFEEPVMAD